MNYFNTFFVFQAVQGPSSTDQDNDWFSHLQSSSPPHVYSNRHFLVLPYNNTLPLHSSLPPEANNDVVALVLYAVLSVLGTTVNIFEISSLIIQENLRHHGNVFLANQALANLLITTFGFPASCIAILSNTHRSPFVCYWQWYIALLSFSTSSLNYFFIAFENLLRAYRRRRNRNTNGGAYSYVCGVKVVVFSVFFSWIAAGFWILVLVFYDNNHDICNRKYGYNLTFLLILAPLSLSALTFLWTVHRYKRHLKELESRQCLESREENMYRQLFKSNALAFLLFICFWLPFTISISTSSGNEDLASPTATPPTPRLDYISGPHNTVETLLTIAQAYSCFCGLVYAFSNGTFGQAFMYLTRYFCCKSHPEFSKSTFQEKPRGTVRVHIGMETRVGERSARANKLMSVVMHDSPRGNHYL
ncbi:g_PROTEIN_RECEP_F1_2 domain-containing protein [Nephila pilipes]|uniref:G_PROTEIN_RECEP_F1_2 domain-containing protein n=1 Tax=Nephila pilipes TaxID=299642 RepID=A0A8X6NUA5_NEPPI|nr:g_PROTEIN_RECEP_F1_2 domain-containing protein [Nephila pilipes]